MSSIPSHLLLALEGVVPNSTVFHREISLLGITLSLGIEEPPTQEETKGGGGVIEKYNKKKKITFKISYFEKAITQSFILDEERPLIKFFFRFFEKIKNIKKHSINIFFKGNQGKKNIITIKKKEI